ncbi:hypothetical protein DL93DRAFT_2189608 [Clavulina sp. PMI_390]|nr:hypothetical protein DL93DRAFT_2189608 [Clavulina sp. PMI_390]
MALGINTCLWESTHSSGNQHMSLGINTCLWESTRPSGNLHLTSAREIAQAMNHAICNQSIAQLWAEKFYYGLDYNVQHGFKEVGDMITLHAGFSSTRTSSWKEVHYWNRAGGYSEWTEAQSICDHDPEIHSLNRSYGPTDWGESRTCIISRKFMAATVYVQIETLGDGTEQASNRVS